MKSMLTPSAADFAGHHAERLGGDRTAQHDDGVGGRLPQHRHVVAALDRDVQADAVDGGAHLVAQLGAAGDLGRTRNQHAQRQPAADDDLFDVEQLDLVPRQAPRTAPRSRLADRVR